MKGNKMKISASTKMAHTPTQQQTNKKVRFLAFLHSHFAFLSLLLLPMSQKPEIPILNIIANVFYIHTSYQRGQLWTEMVEKDDEGNKPSVIMLHQPILERRFETIYSSYYIYMDVCYNLCKKKGL
jgi:hypothetical protein